MYIELTRAWIREAKEWKRQETNRGRLCAGCCVVASAENGRPALKIELCKGLHSFFSVLERRQQRVVRRQRTGQCGSLQLRLTKPTTATATVKSGQWCERRRRMKRCFWLWPRRRHVHRAPPVTPPCNGKGRSDGGLTLNCESSYYIQSSPTTVAAAEAAGTAHWQATSILL
jgi:hypothetical protein